MSKIPVFDIGDTLVPSRKFASHIIEDELRQRNHEPVHRFDPDKFMMYDPDQIESFLDKHGIKGDPEKLAKDCRERYIEAFEDLMVEKDIFDLFARCNEEFGTIGIISDNSTRMKKIMKELLEKHGVDYDTITVSEEVGFEKPDKRIFEAFLGERKGEVENFVYIGNDVQRDSGALEVGMEFIWTKEFDTVGSNYSSTRIEKLNFENLKQAIEGLEK